jgi:hypothetical protein
MGLGPRVKPPRAEQRKYKFTSSEKLLHSTAVDVRRVFKKLQAFHVQKAVKKLKERKAQQEQRQQLQQQQEEEKEEEEEEEIEKKQGEEEKEEEARKKKKKKSAKEEKAVAAVKALEEELKLMREDSVGELVAKMALRKLGLMHTGAENDPMVSTCDRKIPNGKSRTHNIHLHLYIITLFIYISQSALILPNPSTYPLQVAVESEYLKKFITQIFAAKQMVDAMANLNAKCTEHRREGLAAAAKFRDPGSLSMDKNTLKKTKKGSKKRKAGASAGGGDDGSNNDNEGSKQGGYGGASGVFIGSLNGKSYDDYENDNGDEDGEGGEEMMVGRSVYGYADDEYANKLNDGFKNRKGQRARQAKQAAVEARKEGKVWDSSVNWRAKKVRVNDDDEKDSTAPRKNVKAKDVAEMGKNWKEEGKAHPSWAAKKVESSIKEFAGKKITF